MLASMAEIYLLTPHESVTLHSHFAPCGSSISRTRPITRPSKIATPSVTGALSGKVRRQMMLVAFIAVRRLA